MSGFSCSKSNCKLSNLKNASARKYLRFRDVREELIQFFVTTLSRFILLFVCLFVFFVCLFFVPCDISGSL